MDDDWKKELPKELTTEQLARLGPEARLILRWLAEMREAGFDLPESSVRQIVIGILDSVIIGIMRGEYHPEVEKKVPDA